MKGSKVSEKGKMCSTQHPTKGNYLSREIDASVKITDEEMEFAKAIEHYKREYNRPYPNYREILYVAKLIGWSKQPLTESGETNV